MRTRVTLGVMAGAIIYVSPALADDDGPDVEVYGTLLPFFENVGTSGATAAGTVFTPSGGIHPVSADQVSGINHKRRFRMTSGTSNIGFRGGLPVAPEVFKLIWQVESPTPIDGDGPSNWASRNSHVGFTGNWGTFIYGNWDTPMKWATTTSVNPIKGGYVADFIGIIGAPGSSIPAFNADPPTQAIYQIPPNHSGFFRHETNTVQYWSPTIAGFSLRVMYAADEHRTAVQPSTGSYDVEYDPYLVSGYIGWDNSWLRLRYSAEYHHDYFGTGPLVGLGVSPTSPTSSDIGHLGLVMVKLNHDTSYETRVVLVGDYLSFHTDDIAPMGGSGNGMNEFSRPSFYGLIQQHFGSHSIWGSYGAAGAGKCTASSIPAPPAGCSTLGMGAYYITGGYLYSFNEGSGIFAAGYGMFNDIAARYSPFPYIDSRENTSNFLPNILEVAPGADTIGFGVGFVYQFTAKLLGGSGEEPAKAMEVKEAPAPEKKAAPARKKAAAAAPKKKEAPADQEEAAPTGEGDEAPPSAEPEQPPEGEEPPPEP